GHPRRREEPLARPIRRESARHVRRTRTRPLGLPHRARYRLHLRSERRLERGALSRRQWDGRQGTEILAEQEGFWVLDHAAEHFPDLSFGIDQIIALDFGDVAVAVSREQP